MLRIYEVQGTGSIFVNTIKTVAGRESIPWLNKQRTRRQESDHQDLCEAEWAVSWCENYWEKTSRENELERELGKAVEDLELQSTKTKLCFSRNSIKSRMMDSFAQDDTGTHP